ncbi:uncharacterized protein LY89DRAFT_737554 [Mollisia scopiformis]|uniref:Uncharacterized protein n=1 Tax=Mollisia scopiformis TaxID=149040 RepID=A0A194X0T7_MOLSC|nr:uncharacterized protein LY89DRAFT_737554 [Mollisia scopiformis]KUJ13579.1 hypothetical protein LY89DRAFT_737554 [Mollisia scopiformis]
MPLTTTSIDMLDDPMVNYGRDDVMQLIRKIGRIQVLDISREVSKLREIKDIEDELTIMSILFEDQRTVLTTLESVILSKAAIRSKVEALMQQNVDLDEDKPDEKIIISEMTPGTELVDDIQENTIPANESFTEQKEVDRGPMEVSNGGMSSTHEKYPDPESSSISNTPQPSILEIKGKGVLKVSDKITELNMEAHENHRSTKHYLDQVASKLLETWSNSKQRNLPLAIVQRSIDEVGSMFQRAKKANEALDFLVDLKQKQSSVLDARSARIQTEGSLKMTQKLVELTGVTVEINKENERQGKTLMVFTIVTIIFLPLSFMAAFFAINIAAFHRDDKDFLSLGYVSKIMFPISAMITAVLIYIAFRVDQLNKVWPWMKRTGSNCWSKLITQLRQLWNGGEDSAV